MDLTICLLRAWIGAAVFYLSSIKPASSFTIHLLLVLPLLSVPLLLFCSNPLCFPSFSFDFSPFLTALRLCACLSLRLFSHLLPVFSFLPLHHVRTWTGLQCCMPVDNLASVLCLYAHWNYPPVCITVWVELSSHLHCSHEIEMACYGFNHSLCQMVVCPREMGSNTHTHTGNYPAVSSVSHGRPKV